MDGLQLIPNQKNIIISFGRDLKSVKSLSFFTNDDDKENRFDPWPAKQQAANDLWR